MDTLGYLFSSIQNAQKAKLTAVDVPYSKFNLAILKVLVLEGYISGFFTKSKVSSIKKLHIALLYEKGIPMIQKIKRISKPGCRVYKPAHQLLEDRGGFNCLLISSSKGVLSDREALQRGIGGEILCKIE
jgi:small subunit ribosomal protein S8